MNLLSKIHNTYIHTSYLSQEETATRAKLILNTYLTVVCFAFSYSGISILIEFQVGLYSTLILGFSYLFVPFLLRTPNKLDILVHFFLLNSSISAIILIYYSGGLFSAVTPWLAITPIVALLLIGRKVAWFWTIVMVLAVYGFAIPMYSGQEFLMEFNAEWAIPFDAMALSGFILVVFLCNLIFEGEKNDAVKIVQKNNIILKEQQEEIAQQNNVLKFQQVEITEKNEELNQTNEELSSNLEIIQNQNKQIRKYNEEVKASIMYASRIQTALLPFDNHLKEYFGDNFFVLYKPRDIVSGDFYWCEEVNGSIILAVADCTGHGVPGAFMSMLGSMGLNSIVFQDNNFESNKILNALHHYIFQALRQDKSDSRDGMDIAIIVMNPTIKTVEYSGAMNPLYYVQKDEFIQIKADGKPIGGGQYGTERDFSKHYIDTSLPATLYLSTDGYQDQFGGKDKRKFMTGNFKLLLKQIHIEPLSKQKMVLDSTIDAWMQEGNESQIDDILVIGVQV